MSDPFCSVDDMNNTAEATAPSPTPETLAAIWADKGIRFAENDAINEHRLNLVAWLTLQDWSDFFQSLAAQAFTKGNLSPKQWQAAQSGRDKCAMSKARNQTGFDVEVIFEGIEADGITVRPEGSDRSVQIDKVTHGKWAGWFFVKDEFGRKLGSQRPGQTFKGEALDALRWVAANRELAFVTHGKATGHCGICRRQLTNPESVERGIGPVCASRIGA